MSSRRMIRTAARSTCAACVSAILLSWGTGAAAGGPPARPLAGQPKPGTANGVTAPAAAPRPTAARQLQELAERLAVAEHKITELDDVMAGLRPIRNWLLLPIAVVVFVGVGGVVTTIKWTRSAMLKAIDRAMYKVDPTHMPVHVPKHGFEEGKRRLQWLGFRNIQVYDFLSTQSMRSGCVVFPVLAEEDVKTLRDFLSEEDLDPRRLAVAVYSPKIRVPAEIIEQFSNVTFANMLATLGNAVFIVARVLAASEAKKE